MQVVFEKLSLKENISYNANRDEIGGFEDFGLRGDKSKIA